MAQQEEGWPLGLPPLNARVGLARNNVDFSGSVSFNTLLTGSPTSSTDSSSDLDTEEILHNFGAWHDSTYDLLKMSRGIRTAGSFFHDRSITLGSLIVVSSIFELSKRSIRGRKMEVVPTKQKKSNKKSRTWVFSLCSRDTTDAENVNNNNNPRSLGHFLAVERRAANSGCRRNQSPNIYGPEIALAQPSIEPNSLFVNGRIAPPRASPWHGPDVDRRNNGGLEHGNAYGIPVLFSCMCGQSSH